MNETAAVLDHDQIEMLRSLDDGEGAVLAEIVDEFFDLGAPGRDELLARLDTDDRDGLERAAHALKGASANVGATTLADVCARLERHAHETHLDDARALVEQFETEFSRAREALQSEISRDALI